MPFTLKTINGFEMIQRDAAIEIPASRSGHRAFVGISPPLPDRGVHQWRVRRFEISEDLMETNFGETDLLDSQFIRLDTMQEVEELLAKWALDSAAFDAPWKVDYPL